MFFFLYGGAVFYGSPHVETRLRHSLAGSDSARAIGETVAPTSTEKKKKGNDRVPNRIALEIGGKPEKFITITTHQNQSLS